ncbi:MAG: hypothetical protein KGL00_07010 [Gammaproteobacteria bacterium]|nr:hypothetical protein [Gammaproteobacteria bacterium]MDE2140156.1 hypothetical protein [Gammaproteobacteria bacterium]MDE2273934.1 hypothetical protein [Gammaproteobacteria bacterium]
MHITLNINLLVIFTIVGGLIVLLWPALFQKIRVLRYIAGIGLIVLGVLALLGILIPYVNKL